MATAFEDRDPLVELGSPSLSSTHPLQSQVFTWGKESECQVAMKSKLSGHKQHLLWIFSLKAMMEQDAHGGTPEEVVIGGQ